MTSSLSAYQTLERLVAKEVTTASFPTHFSIVLRLRSAMSDKQAPTKRLIQLLNGEPVISAKLLQSANRAAYYDSEGVTKINHAIDILGSAAVRRIALGVAMNQLVSSHLLVRYAKISRVIWLHSLQTAAAASIFAETMTSVHPDEAFFAGLVSNLGAFYLLYRAALSKTLTNATDDVELALRHHSAQLTKRVLTFLELPEKVIDAADFTDFNSLTLTEAPADLKTVVQAAYVFAMDDFPWFLMMTASSTLGSAYHDLRPRIELSAASLHRQYLEV